jgi:hypothetical protein
VCLVRAGQARILELSVEELSRDTGALAGLPSRACTAEANSAEVQPDMGELTAVRVAGGPQRPNS